MIRLSETAMLHHADCRDALRGLSDNSLDSCVTDPPYELNFMGKGWDNTGIANDPALWAEVFRVLKPGGHCAAFSASRTYHRMACAIEDAGFEIRDSLMWVYGTGFPKSQNVARFVDQHLGATPIIVGPDPAQAGRKQNVGRVAGMEGNYGIGEDRVVNLTRPATPEAAEWEGWGTALKPAFEPIVLARKPLSEGTVAANVLRWRCGALNIDACRVGYENDAPNPATNPLYRLQNGYKNAGNDDSGSTSFSIKGRGESSVAAPAGRWPANVVHDGSDEVIGAFPVTGGGGTPRAASPNKGGNWAIGQERSSIPGGATYCDAGSAARFFYSAKASKADRNGSKHPTVKPISLMEWLATLVTPPGGTILDPFAGSGTTGIAATRKGFQVILCEREAEYVADIRARFGDAPRRLTFPTPLPWTELAALQSRLPRHAA